MKVRKEGVVMPKAHVGRPRPMKEKDFRDCIEEFLRRRVQELVVPASMGIGLALGGCGSPALSSGPDSSMEQGTGGIGGSPVSGQGGTEGGADGSGGAPISGQVGYGGIRGFGGVYSAPFTGRGGTEGGAGGGYGGIRGFGGVYSAPFTGQGGRGGTGSGLGGRGGVGGATPIDGSIDAGSNASDGGADRPL